MSGETGRAAQVLDALVERGHTLAAAESLTGGLLAGALTGVPGASRAFRGAVTAYATDVKRDVLGVDAALLAERGAVDGRVAKAMAEGVRKLLGADWGTATTGVAGPDPQNGKPVGTVFTAVSGPGVSRVRELALTGGRGEVRAASVEAALTLLHEALSTPVDRPGAGPGPGVHGEHRGGQGCLQP